MNLDLAALTEQARAGTLHELELLSLEGGVYLLRARLSEGWQLLRDARGESLRLRSTTHLRELLRELPAPPPRSNTTWPMRPRCAPAPFCAAPNLAW